MRDRRLGRLATLTLVAACARARTPEAAPSVGGCDPAGDDVLLAFATARWGPGTCARSVDHAEGAAWPTDTWSFAGGTVVLRHAPPETFVEALTVPGGLTVDDGRALVAELAAAWRASGFLLDLASTPDVAAEGPRTRTTWWDPDEGANAQVGVAEEGGRVVEVRGAWAL